MSHFRSSNLRYERTTTAKEAVFTFLAGFRRAAFFGTAPDGYPQTGDIITDNIGKTTFNFGDGSGFTPTLTFVVQSYSMASDWILCAALDPDDPMNPLAVGLPHTYTTNGPFTAFSTGCCRLANLNNGSNDDYLVSSIIAFNDIDPPEDQDVPPIVTLIPVLNVPPGVATTFPIPATSPGSNTLRYRFATEAESLCTPPVPAGMTIDSATGIVTWNTIGICASSPFPVQCPDYFWTAQVIVEDYDGDVLLTQTPVDFLLKIVSEGVAPTCELSAGTELCANPDEILAFSVIATDPDPGATIEINVTGLPAGAVMVPALPTSGPSGISSSFSWTPTAGDLGVHTVLFTLTDDNGLQSSCVATITVQEEACAPLPPPPRPRQTPNRQIVIPRCPDCLPLDCGSLADDDLLLYSLESALFPFVLNCPLGFDCANANSVSINCCGKLFSASFTASTTPSQRTAAIQNLVTQCARELAFCGTFPGGIPNPLTLYANRPVYGYADCPNGDRFTYQLGAGVALGITQAAADALAVNIAKARALDHRICMSISNDACCFDEEASITVRATGKYIATFPNSNWWEIVAGAIPDGMTFHGGYQSERFVVIDGAPTTSGLFTFTVKVVAPNGDFSQKEFSVCVIEIFPAVVPPGTMGEDYLVTFTVPGCAKGPFNWTIEEGAVAAGLVLDPASGTLSGVLEEDFSGFGFTIAVETEHEPGT